MPGCDAAPSSTPRTRSPLARCQSAEVAGTGAAEYTSPGHTRDTKISGFRQTCMLCLIMFGMESTMIEEGYSRMDFTLS